MRNHLTASLALVLLESNNQFGGLRFAVSSEFGSLHFVVLADNESFVHCFIVSRFFVREDCKSAARV